MKESEDTVMEKLLIAVDIQKDFVDGSLGTAEACEMLPFAEEKIRNFDGTVIFTKDTHGEDYLNTQEGRNLPVIHCIKDTEGWMLAGELEKFCADNNCRVYEKGTFGSTALASDIKALYEEGKIESVTFIGLCTDICVISNALALKAFCPELPICLDEKCCAGVTKEKHDAAVETMKSCQIKVE